jgi:VWFA-related protein
MITRVLLSPLLISSILLPVTGQQARPQPTPEAPPSTPAQQQSPPSKDQDDVVRISTNLVQVDVTVTKDGKPVTDLQAEDFEILEDGKPQKISNFSYVSNVPANSSPKPSDVAEKNSPVPPAVIKPQDARRIVAIVVDDLGLTMPSMVRVKSQIRDLVETLSPNDLVAIIRTSGDIGALQQFTNDKRLLRSAADHLKWNACSRAGRLDQAPAGQLDFNVSLCAGTAPDTFKILRFILRGMGYLPGRKSLILLSNDLPIQSQEPNKMGEEPLGGNSDFRLSAPLSDGPGAKANTRDDSWASYEVQLGRLAEIAIRGSVVIYAVDARGLQTTGLTPADNVTATQSLQGRMNALMRMRADAIVRGREGADLIATQTGGFLVHNSNDFELQRVMTDQEGYYLIGFRPDEETFDRKFHQIKARLKRKGLTVRTRKGFYGYTDEQAHPRDLAPADQMTMALLSPFAANNVTVRLTTFFVDQAPQGALLRSFVHLDARDLTFAEQSDGWRVANVDFKGILFGDNGKTLTEQTEHGIIRLRGAAYDRAIREGIVRGFDLPVKQYGAFQFRVAVRDSNSAHIGSAGQFIEVPDLRKGMLAMSGIVARVITTSNGAPKSAREPSADDERDSITGGPAVRQFRQGATLVLAFAIYNANVADSSRNVRLTRQTRVFRDGKLILTGDPVPIDPEGQSDLKRINSAALFQLGTELSPGEYVLQIIVTDSSGAKPRTVSQWVDFNVVK